MRGTPKGATRCERARLRCKHPDRAKTPARERNTEEERQRSPVAQVEAGADGAQAGGPCPHCAANERNHTLTPSVAVLRRFWPLKARGCRRASLGPRRQLVLRCLCGPLPRTTRQVRNDGPQRLGSLEGLWPNGAPNDRLARNIAPNGSGSPNDSRFLAARVATGSHSCPGRPLAPV